MKYDESGINLKTKEILLSDDYLGVDEECEIGENEKILFAIDTYTQMVHKNIFTKLLLKRMAGKYDVDVSKIIYNKEKKQHEYITDSGDVITFEILSDCLGGLNKELQKELGCQERKGKCHEKSIFLAHANKDTTILTGIISFLGERCIHSVVEMCDKKGNPKILDWTRNFVIDKDEYTKLFKFEILQETDAKVVFDELKIMADLDFDVRTYLTFRDELAKDIEKNKAIFNNSEEQRTVKK